MTSQAVTIPSRLKRYAAAMLLLAAGAGAAQAAAVTEFTVNQDSMPISIVSAPDGNLWFTEFNTNKIGRITPQGKVTEFGIGSSSKEPTAMTVQGGNLWFVEFDKIGKMTTSGALVEYPLPYGYQSDVLGIAAGPDGNVWFTESRCAHCDPNAAGQAPNDGGTIGRITPQGVVTEFTLADYHAGPHGITAGPDGNLWFTENVGNRIARITPSGTVTEFPLPVAESHPSGITAGSDGNLWFTESRCLANCDFNATGVEVIGRITPSGAITEFLTTAGIGGGNGVGTIGIAEAADHNLWFTEPANNRVGRITHAGKISEFDVPTPRPADFPAAFPYPTAPMGITGGPDGNVWFVEAQLGTGGRVGKVDLAAESTSQGSVTITPGFTGSWYNPTQIGHGFHIEILPGNLMLATWYVFTPSGGPTWIAASGPFSGNSATLQAYQAVGAGGLFPPQFDQQHVQPQAWGTLTFTFSDCSTGHVSWQPTAAGYANGALDIQRLTVPAGLSCP